MLVFQIGAGGFNASGSAVVIAETAEHATLLTNLESRERAAESGNTDYDLTYHAMNAKVLPGIHGTPIVKHPHSRARSVQAHVMVLHEYGRPDLPSTGSGIKVTF